MVFSTKSALKLAGVAAEEVGARWQLADCVGLVKAVVCADEDVVAGWGALAADIRPTEEICRAGL
jgi:hypothetical protein